MSWRVRAPGPSGSLSLHQSFSGPIRLAGGPESQGTLIGEDHDRIRGGAATAAPRRGVPDTVPG